jgi:MoxR-like ATPase
VFQKKPLMEIINKHKNTFNKLAEVESKLNEHFYDIEEPVRALILAVATGEPLLLVGDPGTAKSKLIRTFCDIVGIKKAQTQTNAASNQQRINTNKTHGYFEYLLTQFTEPSELFGYYDIEQLMSSSNGVTNRKEGKGLRRLDDGMMQHARVVFLDEVFNASSAILNTLLTFMNERSFHDRGLVHKVPLECLFAATNDIPTTPELRAIFDRFVIRTELHSISSNYTDSHLPVKIQNLLEKGWKQTYSQDDRVESRQSNANTQKSVTAIAPNLLEDLFSMRKTISELVLTNQLIPDRQSPFYLHLASLVANVRKHGISTVSNRRLVKYLYIMLIFRLYRYVNESTKTDLSFGEEELLLYIKYLSDRRSDALENKISQK